ncbi:MAG TPA: hypothetical protein VGB38_02130, partial [bacterium]
VAWRIAWTAAVHQDSADCSCQVGWGVVIVRGLVPLPIAFPRQSHTIALQDEVLESRPMTKEERFATVASI